MASVSFTGACKVFIAPLVPQRRCAQPPSIAIHCSSEMEQIRKQCVIISVVFELGSHSRLPGLSEAGLVPGCQADPRLGCSQAARLIRGWSQFVCLLSFSAWRAAEVGLLDVADSAPPFHRATPQRILSSGIQQIRRRRSPPRHARAHPPRRSAPIARRRSSGRLVALPLSPPTDRRASRTARQSPRG